MEVMWVCGLVALVLVLQPAAVSAQFAQRVVESRQYRIAEEIYSNVTFIQFGVKLPACSGAQLLANKGLPDVWASLSAEEQANSPSNVLFLQLAASVYQNDPTAKLGKCLQNLGLDTATLKKINVENPYKGIMTAYVASAGTRAVFVVIKGTDFEEPGDILTDVDCAHTENLGASFGSADKDIRLHTGFYKGWQVLEEDILDALEDQLDNILPGADGKKQVFVVGHSMGAAIAAIGALRLNHVLSDVDEGAQVAGVHLTGCPRVGNVNWQQEYDQKLLDRTLRISNFADFASRLPGNKQLCPLTTLNATYEFRHVGRSLVLCPDQRTGLTAWKLYPLGSENQECGQGTEPLFAVVPHLLGSYIDAWRRGYAAIKGNVSAPNDEYVASVECDECSLPLINADADVTVIARAGGPITCSVGASCNNRDAWAATVEVGESQMKDYNPFSVCWHYVCT